MTIECPECHLPTTLDSEDIAAAGTEMQCSHCGFSFLVRPHSLEQGGQMEALSPGGEDGPQDRAAPEQAETVALEDRGSRYLQGLPLEAYLATDEVPYAIVEAHLAEKRRAASRPALPPQEVSAGQNMRILDDAALSEEGESWREPTRESAGTEASSFPLERRPWDSGKRTRPGFRRAVLWGMLILAAALCAGALLYFRPFPAIPWDTLRAWSGKISTWMPGAKRGTGSIQFSDLNSYFVSGGKGQTGAFVIEGNVTNHHATACKFVQVKGTLFDAKGDRAAEETAYCGNILKKQEIQSLTPDRIREILQRPSGAALSNLSIEPGKSIPFMLVFLDPPENVSEFSVEILGYQKEDLLEKKASESASPSGAQGPGAL